MGFEQFMKKNQVVDETVAEYAATRSLLDENGKPLLWKFKKVPSRLGFRVTEAKTEQEAIIKLICATCVYPNLRDKELQNSYGVMTPEELIVEMVPDFGEMAKLGKFVIELNAIDLAAEVKEAKN